MPAQESSKKCSRIPKWLRVRLPESDVFARTKGLLRDLGLHTVCQSARCPNIFECFSRGVATFLILGNSCTRACAFCNIGPGRPEPVDRDEPGKVAEAARRLDLKHVVVTSVTRDDLYDGGAGHFADVTASIRQALPGAGVELLIPDFQGSEDALRTVMDAGPDIINHNLETVPELYGRIRPQADYEQSLELIRRVGEAGFRSKSGLMLGLGETETQVLRVLDDLAGAGCEIVTIGQYMRPSKKHPEVARYVEPEGFDALAEYGRKKGIAFMHCAPLVRSSYHAARFA
ncbi:MAG: lipoyl synthase [Thermodesulfobacteriota bacterium]|nr:lipoyl synthase [Thermodesulfobacteriota bacterium]